MNSVFSLSFVIIPARGVFKTTWDHFWFWLIDMCIAKHIVGTTVCWTNIYHAEVSESCRYNLIRSCFLVSPIDCTVTWPFRASFNVSHPSTKITIFQRWRPVLNYFWKKKYGIQYSAKLCCECKWNVVASDIV